MAIRKSIGRHPLTVAQRLERIEHDLHKLLRGQEKLMKANDEVLAFLSQLNTYTNEIAADIDKLLATQDAGLSDEAKAALEAHSATLKAIAAKSGDPLPAPVEPPA